jgi:hypothetical protein
MLDDGDYGHVELGGGPAPPDPKYTLLKVAFAAVIVGGAAWLAVKNQVPMTDPRVLGGLAAYLLVAWLIRPQPDTSNLGWLGGLVNNPFRVSDDWNRFLLFVAIVLGPGRVVTEALEDSLRLGLATLRGQRPSQGGGEPRERGRRPRLRQ